MNVFSESSLNAQCLTAKVESKTLVDADLIDKGNCELDERSGCTFGMHPEWKPEDWDYLRDKLMHPDLSRCYYKPKEAANRTLGRQCQCAARG